MSAPGVCLICSKDHLSLDSDLEVGEIVKKNLPDFQIKKNLCSFDDALLVALRLPLLQFSFSFQDERLFVVKNHDLYEFRPMTFRNTN